MKKKTLWIIAVFFVLLGVGFLVREISLVRYDNDKKFSESVNVTYSEAEIAELKEELEYSKRISAKKYSYYQFRLNFKPQCVRKTFQGYYVILQQDDGKQVFVFFNKQRKLEDILVVEKFLKKVDFDFVEIGETKETDIREFTSDIIEPPYSATVLTATAHILQDGLLVIWYTDRMEMSDMLETFRVRKVEFFSNDFLEDPTLPLNDEKSYFKIPYILPIDKQ